MHPFLFQIVLDLKKRFSLIISPKLVKSDYLGKLSVCSYHLRTFFRVNPHSIVAWVSRKSLLETGAKSEV